MQNFFYLIRLRIVWTMTVLHSSGARFGARLILYLRQLTLTPTSLWPFSLSVLLLYKTIHGGIPENLSVPNFDQCDICNNKSTGECCVLNHMDSKPKHLYFDLCDICDNKSTDKYCVHNYIDTKHKHLYFDQCDNCDNKSTNNVYAKSYGFQTQASKLGSMWYLWQ